MSLPQEAWHHEHGFTLVEVLATILIMGILFAIASSTWFGVVESRRVDSATNQLAADMRLAHTTATNRLAQQELGLTAGSSEYSMTGSPSRHLDDDPDSVKVTVDTTAIIAFCPDGSVEISDDIPPSAPDCSDEVDEGPTTITITVAAFDGAPSHTIEINAVASRIQIVP